MNTFGLQPPTSFDANPYGINAGAKDYASQNYAALTRDVWSSWVTNFMPYENDLIEYARNPSAANEAMAKASTDVNQVFDAQQGATQRRLRGLGLTLDADEQRAVTRSQGLARSLADVTARNVAGTRVRERQQNVLGNPAPMI